MERLKSLVPSNLREMIAQSSPEDLTSTCSSLLEYFLCLHQFQTVIRELSDPALALCAKNREVALDLKKKGNQCFSIGDYPKALSFYTQALRSAPMNVEDADRNLVTTLYVNRASSMHKMGLLVESIQDCNRAIVLFPQCVKAWYRRGKANASLENNEDAVHDMNVAFSMESSLAGKSQIKHELEMMVTHSTTTSSPCNKTKLDLPYSDGQSQIELECVSTPSKGRGMASKKDILPACLVHSEGPYAAIVLKHCRETHCHFCFNELPADSIPCSSCTIALYCSQHCQELAGGKQSGNSWNSSAPLYENLPVDLKKYVVDIALSMGSGNAVFDANLAQIPEHRHECGGVHWPAVLPPDIVLAGRVLFKLIENQRHSQESYELRGVLELSHNYTQIPSESKLELHIYAIVLAYCLQHSGSGFPTAWSSAPKHGYGMGEALTVVIKVLDMDTTQVNSMAVVHMRSLDGCEAVDKSAKFSASIDSLTCSVEQVRVGQAIYVKGSLFNHSCEPNIHAYFLSRTLFLRSTESVPQGSPLELSYGPQVGQWDLKERQELLESQYSFKCQCTGCSELNISDLVINAFRCVKPDCQGAVLDFAVVIKHAKVDSNCLQTIIRISSWGLALPHKKESIDKVAHLLLESTNGATQISPGHCLNCDSLCDIESSRAAAKEAGIAIKRLQDALNSKQVTMTLLSNALKSLSLLRSTRHAYSKEVAQAEDSIAEAFCLMGELQAAMHHCKASIEILERLYHPNHIVVANELVKLVSIQLSLNDQSSTMNTINRLQAIFTLYYGSHCAKIFPYIENLQSEVNRIALQMFTEL